MSATTHQHATRPWQAVHRATGAAAIVACACLPVLSSPAAAQETFGRLFFTPVQRSQLDAARRRPPAPEAPPAGMARPAPPPAPQSMSVDGIVRRDDGRATVWVNSKPVPAPQRSGPVRLGPVGDPAEGADLALPDRRRQVRIKVGQEVDTESGRIEERYRRPPPAPDAAPAGLDAQAGKPAGAGAPASR